MRLRAFITGMGVGAVAALIFAPRSGEDTREIIAEKAAEGRRYAEDRVQEIRDLADETVEQGKEVVGRQKKAVAAAARAAKDTYTRELQKGATG